MIYCKPNSCAAVYNRAESVHLSILVVTTISPCHSLMMNPAILYLVFVAIVAFDSTLAAQPESTCQACNCQFNNIQVLSQLIESKLASGELGYYTVNAIQFIRVYKF